MLPTLSLYETPQGGFNFENCARLQDLSSALQKRERPSAPQEKNSSLEDQGQKLGLKAPKARKTGTTIAGIIYKDGVILGADRRATDDMIVADKNCAKIHYITDNIYCCGAGVAADAENVTQVLSSNLHLHTMSTGRQPRVCIANRMLKQMLYRYRGHVGASIIIGGVDVKGPHLYSVYPHGSTDATPFTALGSGSSAAIAVLEDRYKPNMEPPPIRCEIRSWDWTDAARDSLHALEEAKQLVTESITAGILCDLGSGSGVDLCVITKDGAKILRGHTCTETKGKRLASYRYPRGTTAVVGEKITHLDLVEETVQIIEME